MRKNLQFGGISWGVMNPRGMIELKYLNGCIESFEMCLRSHQVPNWAVVQSALVMTT